MANLTPFSLCKTYYMRLIYVQFKRLSQTKVTRKTFIYNWFYTKLDQPLILAKVLLYT